MDAEKLIRMAEQIATFFASGPDRTLAIGETAQHIRRTWDPRMRRDLFRHVDAHGTAGMGDLLRDVVETRRAELDPGSP